MTSTIVPMPVTIEQVAAVVRNMSRDERQRLLDLVPDLQETPKRRTSNVPSKAQSDVMELRREILAALDGQPLAPDDLFVDNLTVGDYLALPDNDSATENTVRSGAAASSTTASAEAAWRLTAERPSQQG